MYLSLQCWKLTFKNEPGTNQRCQIFSDGFICFMKMDCVISSNSTVLCTCHPKEIPTFTDLSNLNPLDPWKSLLKIVAKKLRKSSPSPRATGSGNAAHRRRLNMRQPSTHPKPNLSASEFGRVAKQLRKVGRGHDGPMVVVASGHWLFSSISLGHHIIGTCLPTTNPSTKGFCKIGALSI